MPPTQRAIVAPCAAPAPADAQSVGAGLAALEGFASDAREPGGAVASEDSIDLEWVEAQFSRLDLLLRTLAEPEVLAGLLLRELAPLVGATQGASYSLPTSSRPTSSLPTSSRPTSPGNASAEPSRLVLRASYGLSEGLLESVALGEGLLGQCAVEGRKLRLRDAVERRLPELSAYGARAPAELAFIPVWLSETTLCVLELGFASSLAPSREALLDRLVARRPPPGQAVSHLVAAREPPPRRPLPSHRSGFWGKLSHELRSPLNSVLVLSQLLSENEEHNLTPKQVEFAKAIHASGNDLLALVNAISDLTKIETNRLVLEPTEMRFDHFKAHLERAFTPVAKERGLDFAVELGPGLPAAFVTDVKRLRQIMKCLLSNAFKFTESGHVAVKVSVSRSGWSADRERLNNALEVLAFSVTDTGVGMSESEQRSILEVFPPERIEPRRGLGASGLGLAISRELGRLLGGDLRVSSVVGNGSTFTLYLPTCGLPSAAVDDSPPESVGAPEAPGVSVPRVQPGAEALSDGASGRGSADAAAWSSGNSRGKRRDAPGAASGTELAGLRIMLVDDDVRSAFALTGLLERQGAAVSHAEGVSEALERLGESSGPAALLVDVELLMSGYDGGAAQVLEGGGQLPVIALTGPRRESSEAGDRVPPWVHRLAKPIDTAELLSLLSAVNGRAKSLES